MTTQFTLSEEVALDQLETFFNYYDMDVEDLTDGLESDDDTYKATERSIKRIVKNIRKGKIEIFEDDGVVKIKQHLKSEKELVYGELTAKAKIAMGKKAETDYNSRIYALCGALTGIGEKAILKLKGADISVCECIGFLFLSV